MECNHILVRFGELTTKGKNRKLFIRKLCQNTKEILNSFQNLKYELSFDRMYILLNGEDAKAVCRQLKTVFGIHSFSLCYQVKSDLESIKEACPRPPAPVDTATLPWHHRLTCTRSRSRR